MNYVTRGLGQIATRLVDPLVVNIDVMRPDVTELLRRDCRAVGVNERTDAKLIGFAN